MQDKRAKRYENIKLALSISETIISLILLVAFIFGGYSVEWRSWVTAQVANPYLQLLLFLAGLGIAYSFISFPLSYISGYWLEHRFQLSNQSFGAWLWEQTKAFLVGIVLLIPIILVFYFFLINYPQTWWLWTAVVIFVFTIIIGRITPQFILPLFNKFEPLENEELLQRMKALAEKGRFHLEGIFRFDMSKSTKKANAAFTGIGKTRRIILGDTLLDNFSVDEIEAVFAHEVGHYLHKHLAQGVITGTLITFISLFIADYFYQDWLGGMGYSGPADLAALPLLSLILSIIAFITTPLSNILSRRNERQADRYALANSTNAQAFISAMEKLSEMNLADKEPHPLVEFLFHSHPSIASRITMSRKILGIE